MVGEKILDVRIAKFATTNEASLESRGRGFLHEGWIMTFHVFVLQREIHELTCVCVRQEV